MDEKTLGINVAEAIRMADKVGPASKPSEEVVDFEANAIGLVLVKEDGTAQPIRYTLLNKDGSNVKFVKGRRYAFKYHVEVR